MAILSEHFDSSEFACRCRKTLTGCQGTIVVPRLVTGLESLRRIGYPGGLLVASGYRCTARNRAVHGASQSQHLYGAAADISMRVTLADVIELEVFSGIGWQDIDGRRLVRHVDVRHCSGHNTTRGTVTKPTIWKYP